MNAGFLKHQVETELTLNSSKVAQIEQLTEKRTGLIGLDGVEVEIQEIDQRIEELKDSLGKEQVPSMEQLEEDVLRRPLPPALLGKWARQLETPKPESTDVRGKEDAE